MAIDWDKKFKPEYDKAREQIAKNTSFAPEWRDLIRKLESLMGSDGFNAAHENALKDLQTRLREEKNREKITEDEGILKAINLWPLADTATLQDDKKKQAACLKLLRHIYLQNKYGNSIVWVFNLPDDFNKWPSQKIADTSTSSALKQLLKSKNEHFSDQQRRYLGNSTQQALAWCQKANMTLANATSTNSGVAAAARDSARATVRLWFAEGGLADSVLDTYIAKLTTGFKNIVAMLNKGRFVVTDWVPFRGTTNADEIDFLNSEAFTFSANGEGMDVVYIESSFFTNDAGGVVHDQKNWTRIIVHELSHLVVGTEDVVNGDARYAWYGIGPHSGYPGADCIRNADNWAFFAADCAGALVDSERNHARRIR